MRSSLCKLLAASAFVGAVGFSSPALAQTGPAPSDEAVSERERGYQAKIDELEKRLEALEALLGPAAGGGQRLPDTAQESMRGRGADSVLTAQRYGDNVVAVQDNVSGGAAAASLQEDRKTPAPAQSVEAVIEAEQGHFGDRLSFEAGVTYSHFDDARINLSGFLALDAIFLGRISIDEITADIITTDFTTRYGLTDRLQVDLTVPYLYRVSNFQSGGAGGDASGLSEITVRDSGFGDISAGASYRLLRETPRRPDVVINARVKAPTGKSPFGVELVEVEGSEGNLEVPERLSTGSGVWGASAGISLLKTIDPMVVFGSVTYFHNFKKNFDDLDEAPGDQPGWAKLGDAIQYGAGVAFALNERSSLSLSFTQRFVERTKLRRDGDETETIVGSQANVGLLNLGATFSLTDKIALLTTLGTGLTADAPDMVLSVRVPFRF